LLTALAAASPTALTRAQEAPRLDVKQGIGIGGSVSTITNTVNQQDPAVLAAMAKTFADQMAASNEARADAERRAAEFGAKLSFTTAAVAEVFKILGEQSVSEEKVPARLIEIVTHFVQTRDSLAALAPDDPEAAKLSQQAKAAFASGRLAEADALLERAKDLEAAAFREASRLRNRRRKRWIGTRPIWRRWRRRRAISRLANFITSMARGTTKPRCLGCRQAR
jgi:hypothetical protein